MASGEARLRGHGRDTATRIGKNDGGDQGGENRFTRFGEQTVIVELPKRLFSLLPRGGHRVGRLSGLFTLCGLPKVLPN
ncbi:hypothetical protein [Kumtagia ephedrae]|jgi:hypothetical protein|uniref:hypothetical protein n=1 Tax=Kumtagia ephedrae TaxID=2116701 RepID=UPI0014026FC7|nr:hypothetical protein [Mesorhizobium ephedrae]